MIYTASLMCANPLRLEEDAHALMEGGIDTFHLDFMDGCHVPALGLTVETAVQLRAKFPRARLDAHLMVTHPENLFEPLAEAGVDWITVVPQTLDNSAAALETIRGMGIKAGFALNPDMTVEEALPLLPLADLVVVMSIQPGRYGALFQDEAYSRIRRLKELRDEKSCHYLISVDGGITRENGLRCREQGADMLVLGIFTVFRQPQGILRASRDFINAMAEG